jgi:hypothetical protein
VQLHRQTGIVAALIVTVIGSDGRGKSAKIEIEAARGRMQQRSGCGSGSVDLLRINSAKPAIYRHHAASHVAAYHL